MNPLCAFKTIKVTQSTVDLDQQLQTDRDLSANLDKDELIVRLWTSQGIILGKLDSVLPDFQKGLDFLHDSSYRTMIRKAGGLAVVCDDGILNLSLLFSKEHPLYGGLNEAYAFGVDIIKTILADLQLDITAGEISASYCPGKYDLSVDGRKFCGMAQYRSKDAVMVMIMLCVSGDQKARCALIKDFYALANPDHDPKYPLIDPASMETLSNLSIQALDVPDLVRLITDRLSSDGTLVNL